jgi:hypothetical protein
MLTLNGALSLMMIFVGPVSGFEAAHAHKAGLVAVILFTIGGSVMGFAAVGLSFKLLALVKLSKKANAIVPLCITVFIQYAILAAVIVAPFLFAEAVFGQS